jgi:uncharacterized protein DUF4112
VLQRAWPVEHEQRLAALRRLKHFLDDAYRVPGTSIRFGWDALIGMVPWLGDVTTALMSCAIIVQAHSMGVPRVVQVRMVINVIIDLFIGFVPLFGDVADVFWKSNTKNFALLERHLGEVPGDTRGDWIFVGSAVGIILLVAIVPFVMMYWIVHSLMSSGIHSPFF